MAEETTALEKASVPQLPAPVARRGLDEFTWRALVNSVFPGAASESILMAVDYCKARGLDVLKRPVHIVPMQVKDAKTGQYQWRDIIMPGISELRTTAARTGEYAGQDEPVFGQEILYKEVYGPETCTVTVYRFTHGQRVAFTHTERFREAVVTKKDGAINSMWSKRPYGQLAKCTEAGALRKAFPEEIGNEYTAEEMTGQVLDTPQVHIEEEERASRPTLPRRKSEKEPPPVPYTEVEAEPYPEMPPGEAEKPVQASEDPNAALAQEVASEIHEKQKVRIRELSEVLVERYSWEGKKVADILDIEGGSRVVGKIPVEKLAVVTARLEVEVQKAKKGK